MITQTLAGLRDVDDVRGSFLVSSDGSLLARDLPAMFHSDIFAEIGPRLTRLRETLESEGDPISSLTLRFAEHKLHLRAIDRLFLGVVTSAKVNGPALRMAINLVARRVASQAHELELALEATRAAEPASADPARPAPPVGTLRAPGVMGRTDITFRGRKL